MQGDYVLKLIAKLKNEHYKDLDLTDPAIADYKKSEDLLTYFALNSKYLDLPREHVQAINVYLTLCKIAHREVSFSEFRHLSEHAMYYLMVLQKDLMEKKGIRILKKSTKGTITVKDQDYDDWYVSLDDLKDYIDRAKREKQSIAERLEDEIEYGDAGADVGNVKLKPFYKVTGKLAGLTVEDSSDGVWSVADMKKLAADLLAAAEIKEQQKTKE